jgi:hypothetical protein
VLVLALSYKVYIHSYFLSIERLIQKGYLHNHTEMSIFPSCHVRCSSWQALQLHTACTLCTEGTFLLIHYCPPSSAMWQVLIFAGQTAAAQPAAFVPKELPNYPLFSFFFFKKIIFHLLLKEEEGK